MTITTQDIQLYQPEVLDDTNNGGGRMSPNQVVDGELNNIFDDQSRFDRVTGRVSLRKSWMAVVSENRTKLLGAHAILLQRALDPKVFVSMFGRDDHTDRRLQAQQHLEQYLAKGPATGFYCYETQPEGALSIVLFTHPNNEPPAGGDTLVLSVERGTVNLNFEQYVRCVKVSTEIITISTNNSNNVTTKLITIEIDQPLRFDVPGELLTDKVISTARTVVRRTTLAGGKRYYSIHPLTSAADSGDLFVQLDGITTPVVPSAQQQQGITDQQIGSDGVAIVPLRSLGDAEAIHTESCGGASIINGAVFYQATRAVIPGSGAQIELQPSGQSSSYRAVLQDDGRGNMVRQPTSGGSVPSACVGVIDYETGGITVTDVGVTSGSTTSGSLLTYRPGAAIVDVQHTDGEFIELVNRRLIYNRTLVPKPMPGSTQIEYRALGRWITLRDRGDGTMAGNEGEGAGTINYATGTVNVTLGIEPDLGSHVLYGWGSGAHYQGPTEDVVAMTPEFRVDLPVVSGTTGPILPETVEISYEIGETMYTASDDGEGNITGDATGFINYPQGVLMLRLTTVPAKGTVISVEYQRRVPTTETPPSQGIAGGTLTVTLSTSPVTPGSLRLDLSTIIGGSSKTFQAYAKPDGTIWTLFKRLSESGRSAQFILGGVQIGTINHTSGEVLLDEVIPDLLRVATWTPPALGLGGEWTIETQGVTLIGADQVDYSAGAASAVDESLAPTVDELTLQLEDEHLLDGVVPTSFLLNFNTRSYFDIAGILYYRDDVSNVQAGSINYETGQIKLTSWEPGTATAEVMGVLVSYGRWGLTEVYWRVPAEQLSPGSFQLTYQQFSQEEPFQANSDNDGDIAGTGVTGEINFQTGVYQLTFAAEVIPELSRYNAVSIAFLPLDPDIIGLDPVRLSVDGKVPTVQKADVAVIHNTQETELPDPAVAGQTYATRAAVTVLEIFDAEGERIPTDRYEFDNETGDITMANPLDLDDYVQPLTARHRIEDMVLVTDAQLNGVIGLNAAITHDYPAETSFLSTALPLGNELQASAFNLFTQASWSGEWSDVPIGGGTSGQYNAVAFPIETSNRGAIRERWRIQFTSVTAFRVIGETVGEVATGDTLNDVSPNNPATGAPYFTIRAGGWSGGWNIGNQVRFNTEAAARPIWFNRTTLPGPLTDPTDRVQIELRGDAN